MSECFAPGGDRGGLLAGSLKATSRRDLDAASPQLWPVEGEPVLLAAKPGNFEETRDNILLAFFQKNLNCRRQT
jgi:hypothetical protein